MKCEIKLMGKHVKEAAKELPTGKGIGNLIAILLLEGTIIIVAAILFGVSGIIAAVVASELVALVWSYVAAVIECKDIEEVSTVGRITVHK